MRARRRTTGPRALAVLVALAAMLVAAPTAAAHAELETTEPANEAVLETSPGRVVLHFTEPVETEFGAVRVFDSAAQRVDTNRIERPSRDSASVELPPRLPFGTYTVTYRVVSADGHPVRGSIVFHVGAPSANAGGVADLVQPTNAPRYVGAALAVTRALTFGLILLLAGGSAMLALGLRNLSPEVETRVLTVLAWAAAFLATIAVATIHLQGASAAGVGLSDALGSDTVVDVFGTRYGRVWLAAGVIAVVCAILLSARLVIPATALAAVLVAAPSASGHASVSGAVAFVADVAHVAAAAAWAGGLAVLVAALVWSRESRWRLASTAVPRFSALAVGAVAVLVVAGTVNAYLQIRSFDALWNTTYGQVLLVKLALVVPLLALGAYNNRYSVPRLRERIASAAERARFLKTTGLELAAMVAIVGVTAILVAEPPARAQAAQQATAAPARRPGPITAAARMGPLDMHMIVAPATAGRNEITIHFTDQTGDFADVAEASVNATLPSAGIGPLRLELKRVARGQFVTDGTLALPGDWRLRVDARQGEFDAYDATVTVDIGKDAT